ncbi:hypothetical protein [Pseudomonas brassicacearum]|uniref:Big-1 domain-containing protein n=1 Tax=Pseudomonas brassicacearum subsp. neoaurantiaca TaxID=494916 RepID=A0A7V8UC22_9PSED|nr:hypothetical protein [Pseudomonas brassicacearum]MBA1379161.1 hypothetical protein [Pseudomonas brassicacearum subsp. neoaurantiaca]
MNKQSRLAVRANESLVLNGDFQRGFINWTKDGNSRWLSTGSDNYQGEQIPYLVAGGGASVFQTFRVPKAPGDSARYVLSFLCESRQDSAGRLVVEVDGKPDNRFEIALEPTGKAQRLAQQQGAEPLVFEPIVYHCQLDDELSFDDQDTLKLSVISAPNAPDDDYSLLYITRIKLQVLLEPLVLQTIKLDDQSLSVTERLPLCLGAEHRLEFVPASGNAWEGTLAALTSDDNPQEAIIATPGWGMDHDMASPWLIECPQIGNQYPYRFCMKLINQYTAEAHPVEVSLGHHRLAFLEVREATYFPVLEYGQSVCLGVRVGSPYTEQALTGQTVNWNVTPGQVKTVSVTDDQGWAYFEYQPTQAGGLEIEASVESLYYGTGVVAQTFPVRVLETDPWNDVRVVVEREEAPWAEKTGYPNRGSDYALELRLPEALIGTDLSLRWSGDSHEQLGVGVNPALDLAVRVDDAGLTWTLTSEDKLDGLFSLELVCSKLLSHSPKKSMSLARNLVKVGEVREANKFPLVDDDESVLLRVQVVHVTSQGDGEPVVNAQVEWSTPEETSATVTGNGGWASFLYTPISAGDKVVTASIKSPVEAAPVTHAFNVTAIASSPWKGNVNILLDGEVVEPGLLGVLCRRGQTHVLKVVPVAGSSWIGRDISLHWRGSDPDIGLVLADLGTAKPLIAACVEWRISSQAETSTSSLFDLELRLAGEETVRELSGRLVAMNLLEEVSLRFDQIDAALDGQPLYPCLGAQHRFTVMPNALSPLVGLTSKLTWSGASAAELGATVEPALANGQPISDGGASWTLDFTGSEVPGEFNLAWELSLLDFQATAKPMQLGHNKVRIQAWRDSAVDPVVGEDPAWVWVQVFSHFTGQGVAEVPVTWAANDSRAAHTDAEGWAGFDVQASSAGEQTVMASVISAYDGYQEQRTFEVTALTSDPWEDLTVSFDGAESCRWGEKTYFPRRDGKHELVLTAPANSPLLDGHLTLGMTGTGPTELGITFTSGALGVARQFEEGSLRYAFNVGNLKDGSFALCLASQRLARLSPANALSVGEGNQVLEFGWDTRADQTLDWKQELVEHITIISSVNRRPVAGVAVNWHSADLGTVATVTNYYGVARIRFVPTTPGAAQLTATVGSGDTARSITRTFSVNEPREIKSLTSEKTYGHFGEEVSALATVVSAIDSKPLQGVEVQWDYPGITLDATKTDADGVARVTFSLTGIWRGGLEAVVKGGSAGWEVKHLEFGLLPAPDMDVVFDGMPVVFGGAAYPCHGATHTIRVSPTLSSRLSGMHIRLIWDGDAAEEIGAEIRPPLEEAQLLTDEGVTWELDFSGTSRNVEFSLSMEVVETGEVSERLVMSLGHNLVTAERWATEHQGWPEWETYFVRYIRATSVYLNQPAPYVIVRINGAPIVNTNANGVYSTSEQGYGPKYLSIVNWYNMTIV